MSTAPAATTQRRYDPRRRDRIINACLDVIAQNGVAGTSHRKVAEAADVPLGSMTYHFAGMQDLLHEAFSRFALTASEQFEELVAAAHDAAAAKKAIAAAITHNILSNQRDLVLTHELYTWPPENPRTGTSLTPGWLAVDRRWSSTSTRPLPISLAHSSRVYPSIEPSVSSRTTRP